MLLQVGLLCFNSSRRWCCYTRAHPRLVSRWRASGTIWSSKPLQHHIFISTAFYYLFYHLSSILLHIIFNEKNGVVDCFVLSVLTWNHILYFIRWVDFHVWRVITVSWMEITLMTAPAPLSTSPVDTSSFPAKILKQLFFSFALSLAYTCVLLNITKHDIILYMIMYI